MLNNRILMVINPIMALLMLSQIVTGIAADRLPRNVFKTLHVGGGFALLFLACAHLVLNWSWVKRFFLQRKGKSSPKPGKPF